MAHGPLSRSMETVDVFRVRLNSLYTLCDQVAAQHGAQTGRDVAVQEPFNAQMSSGGTAELPLMQMVKGRVEVSLHPSEISSDMQGGITRRCRWVGSCSERAGLIHRHAGPISMTPAMRAGTPAAPATSRSPSMRP